MVNDECPAGQPLAGGGRQPAWHSNPGRVGHVGAQLLPEVRIIYIYGHAGRDEQQETTG